MPILEHLFVSAIEKIANTIKEGNKEMVNAFTRATETMANAISSSQQRTYSPSEIYTELLQMKLDQLFLDEAYFWLADNEKRCGYYEVSQLRGAKMPWKG